MPIIQGDVSPVNTPCTLCGLPVFVLSEISVFFDETPLTPPFLYHQACYDLVRKPDQPTSSELYASEVFNGFEAVNRE